MLLLIAGLLSALALVGSAAGTTATSGTKVRHLQVPVGALAIDGSRIAYDASARYVTSPHAANKVLVWNLRTGKTVKVSGKKTAAADSTSTGAGVFQLALAGTRVTWLLNEGGNLEGDDYLFTSSVTKPKAHQVASAIRSGDGCRGRSFSHCAGPWLGGVVGSGNLIAANRWTTDGNGVVTAGQLDVVSGTKLKQVAIGASTVQAAVADSGRLGGAACRRERRPVLGRRQAAADGESGRRGDRAQGQEPRGGHDDAETSSCTTPARGHCGRRSPRTAPNSPGTSGSRETSSSTRRDRRERSTPSICRPAKTESSPSLTAASNSPTSTVRGWSTPATDSERASGRRQWSSGRWRRSRLPSVED
jgi:hypothetical protein